MTTHELAERMRVALPATVLLTAESSAVASLDLSSDSKDFLTTIGLPDTEFLGFSFRPVQTLRPIRQMIDLHAHRDREGDDGRCIAENSGTLMVVDPAHDGVVRLIDLEQLGDDMFVNSAVQWLGAFVAECAMHWHRCRAGVDRAQSVVELGQWMRSVDRRAVEDPTSWWATVLEELEIGLL